MKLLLAEDDPMIGASMEQGLRMAGFAVDWVRDGKAAGIAPEQIAYSVLRHGVEPGTDAQEECTDQGQFVSQIWDTDGTLAFSSNESVRGARSGIRPLLSPGQQ